MTLAAPQHSVPGARILGLPVADGLIPWATWQAQSFEEAWAFITPCHWQVGSTGDESGTGEFPGRGVTRPADRDATFFAENGIKKRHQKE